MTGYELAWFFEDLLYDITNPSGANVVWLLVRLVIVFVVSMTLYSIGKRLIEDLWRSVVKPLLMLVWRLLTAPVRLPIRWFVRGIVRPLRRRRERRRYEEAEQRQHEEQRAQAAREAEDERQRLAELERILRVE